VYGRELKLKAKLEINLSTSSFQALCSRRFQHRFQQVLYTYTCTPLPLCVYQLHLAARGAWEVQVAGSLRTSTRTDIGASLTFRVSAHTEAWTWFVNSTSVECVFSMTPLPGSSALRFLLLQLKAQRAQSKSAMHPGLTRVHFSAQRKRFLRERGCI
jgi:hypothetical protein